MTKSIHRTIFIIGFSIILAMICGTAVAEDTDVGENIKTTNSILLDISKGTEIAGGIITLGFGIWHFFIPSLFGWYDYLRDKPEELTRAISATNFFLSFSLSLIGGTSVVLPTIFPEAETFNIVWLWANTALWTARSVYQMANPQGTQIKGLAPAMLTGFILTDLLFLFSAVVNTVLR